MKRSAGSGWVENRNVASTPLSLFTSENWLDRLGRKMGFIFMAVVIFCCFLVSHKTTEARPWLTTRSNFNKITEIDSQVADIFQRVASTSPAPELLPIPDDIINLMQVSLHQVVEIHELAKYVNNQLINSNNPATKVSRFKSKKKIL